MLSEMTATPQLIRPHRAVTVGLLGLAAAMGIGRFAFTPLLPLMQQHDGVTLVQGGSLAAANYLGYLVGALACVWLRAQPGTLARVGLLATAVSTLAMGWTDSFALWWLWRAAAGAASALVLVGVSAWSLAALAQARALSWAGGVFAGVGTGIAIAGVVVLVVAMGHQPSSLAWIVLGGSAALVAAVAWRPLGATALRAPVTGAGAVRTHRLDAAAWRLVICYGVVGFGYILPATFLPAVARELFPEPTQYGWTWPLFGSAAAASTIVAAWLFRDTDPRRLWAVGQLIMAAGVLALAVSRSSAALLFAAMCVGGTFMVLTMAGLQLARSVASNAASRVMAAMTTAFAVGQVVGPLAVSAAAWFGASPRAPNMFAALLLVLAVVLLRGAPVHALPSRHERISR
jgi:MFS family permease